MNSEVEVMVPPILTYDIDKKLELIENLGGKGLKGKMLLVQAL